MNRHVFSMPLLSYGVQVIALWSFSLLICETGCAGTASAVGSGTIAAGTDHAIPYSIYGGSQSGPTVLIAVIGDDKRPAPSLVIQEITAWPVLRGRLIVIPQAIQLDGNASARDVEAFVREVKPDWVVELTEAEKISGIHASLTDASRIQAARLVDAANRTIAEGAAKFSLDDSGHGVGPLGASAHSLLSAPTITLVTTATGKGQPESLRMRQHRFVVHQLLSDLKMIDVDANTLVPSDIGGRIRVAMYDAEGSGSPGPSKMEPLFATLPDILMRRVGPSDVQAGVLRQFDMLIQPGGTGHGQANALGEAGREAIRKFVNDGGGFIGICAGSYLSTCKYEWSLGLINAKTVDSKHYARGRANLQIELTPLGREILGDKAGEFTCLYHNGPVLAAADDPKLPPFEPLAYYRTEAVAKGAEKGLMVGTPAMIAGKYGKGKVISISPHPEQTPGLESFVPRAIRWTVGRPVEGPAK